MTLLTEALAWWNRGHTPLPVAPDGSKRPAVTTWKDHQDTQPDAATIVNWFTTDHDGLGLICGKASGGLIMVEFEGRAITEGYLDKAAQAFADHDALPLWEQVTTGYSEQTPSGGLHLYVRTTGNPPGNTRLARRPSTPDELATNPHNKIQVLIETRGQGGFTVIAPSHGRTHPTGHPWTTINGSKDTIPTLTGDDLDLLLAVLSTLDQMPTKEPEYRPTPGTHTGTRPGDQYNNEATWADILTPHGWTLAWQRGRLCGWTRPGKHPRDGISATTGRNDADNLYVFSSSTEFDTEEPYSKFAAYTLLEHHGDYTAAARALAPLYGDHLAPDNQLAGLLNPTSTTTVPAVDNVIPLHRNDGTTALQAAPDPVDVDPAELIVDRLAREELFKLRARARAREWFTTENTPPAEPFDLDTLAGVLARPADPPQRIGQLMPWAAAMLLIAQRKAGKTTFELNLARTLIAGGDFLGRFPVIPIEGTVALLNYEVSARQIATWADEHGVDRDRLVLVNLRGRRNPLADPDDTSRLATELRARQVESVIVDPFGRAYTGQSQNDAGEVGQWLIRLDEFVRGQVGALDLILTAHAGWNGERTRGSSALEDWGDVLVNITRDKDDNNDEDATGSERYFRAEGRDVDIAEDLLLYDDATRTLTLAGSGGRQQRRKTKKVDGLVGPILEVVRAHPGIGSKDLTRRLREGLGGGVRDESVSAAIKHLVETGQVWRPPYKPGIPWPINPGQQPLTHPGSTR